jgi:hypothetical protein
MGIAILGDAVPHAHLLQSTLAAHPLEPVSHPLTDLTEDGRSGDV